MRRFALICAAAAVVLAPASPAAAAHGGATIPGNCDVGIGIAQQKADPDETYDCER